MPLDVYKRQTQAWLPPHWNWVPPPPQVCGAAQEPQSIVPPQPSPMRPQLALSEAQVTRPQPLAISPVGSGLKSSLPPEMTESLQPMVYPIAAATSYKLVSIDTNKCFHFIISSPPSIN